MFKKFFSLFGLTRVSPAMAREPKTIQEGRPLSDVEAMVRIRNLLSDSRFRFRTLATLAEAVGRDYIGTVDIIRRMADVRPARDNERRSRPHPQFLYTFAG